MIICPRCGELFEEGTGAPSRKDNSVEVCDKCRLEEALESLADSFEACR